MKQIGQPTLSACRAASLPRLRIDRDDRDAVLQRENEPVEPRRHERIRPRDQALHLGRCSQPDPVDVEARVDRDDSGVASADERVDRRIRQFRQAGRVRLHLADADDRNEGRVAQEHEIRSRRPRAVALPEAVEGVPAVEVFGNERLSPKTGVPSKWCKKRSSSSPH